MFLLIMVTKYKNCNAGHIRYAKVKKCKVFPFSEKISFQFNEERPHSVGKISTSKNVKICRGKINKLFKITRLS